MLAAVSQSWLSPVQVDGPDQTTSYGGSKRNRTNPSPMRPRAVGRLSAGAVGSLQTDPSPGRPVSAGLTTPTPGRSSSPPRSSVHNSTLAIRTTRTAKAAPIAQRDSRDPLTAPSRRGCRRHNYSTLVYLTSASSERRPPPSGPPCQRGAGCAERVRILGRTAYMNKADRFVTVRRPSTALMGRVLLESDMVASSLGPLLHHLEGDPTNEHD